MPGTREISRETVEDESGYLPTDEDVRSLTEQEEGGGVKPITEKDRRGAKRKAARLMDELRKHVKGGEQKELFDK